MSVVKRLLSTSAIAAGLGCIVAPLTANAAENGAGFYLLGARGPMAGLLAPPGTYFQNDTYFYVGELKGNKQLPLGGEIVGEVDATLIGIFGTGLWVMPEEVLGGNLGFTAIVPFGGPDIDATLSAPRAGRSASVSDSVFTIGDPVLGAVLGWHEGDFHWTANASVNVPIGDYQKGSSPISRSTAGLATSRSPALGSIRKRASTSRAPRASPSTARTRRRTTARVRNSTRNGPLPSTSGRSSPPALQATSTSR
ncbi:outer membrane putative beta-barrel porin/alpha-amylase [Ensifer adhaerens]|nr:outer membrane putative beta-barrel porin/alpha-amylase [Ensifer adhaerens]